MTTVNSHLFKILTIDLFRNYLEIVFTVTNINDTVVLRPSICTQSKQTTMTVNSI